MKKNIVIVLLLLLMLAGGAGTFYFYREFQTAVEGKEQVVQQNMELQVAIDAIGPTTTVWTVNTDVIAGAVVREEELVEQTIPASSVTDVYITSKKEAVGKYYKVDISPGVSLTKDILMGEALDGIVYERDLYFSYLPLGLKVGDYIDIRMVLPYGQEFTVVGHERVQKIVEDTSVVKVYFDESQLALWNSALKDLALYSSKGLSLYVTKYLEPGITDEAIPYYPVRTEMENVVTLNPNIMDKSVCINSALRVKLDEMIAAVDDEDASYLSSGVADEASAIESSRLEYTERQQATGSMEGEDGKTLEEEYQESYDDLINLDPEDLTGNKGSVTGSDVEDARGDNPFEGENNIE